jgi:hypothetical protein
MLQDLLTLPLLVNEIVNETESTTEMAWDALALSSIPCIEHGNVARKCQANNGYRAATSTTKIRIGSANPVASGSRKTPHNF